MATDSTIARRILGMQLETLRERADITRDAAATAIASARSTIWKMETGQPVRFNPVLIERLCQLYNATEKETQVVLELVKETKGAKGWWQAFAEDTIPKDFNLFVGLEDAANRITSYQTTFLPGLLHTEEYKRALIWTEFPNKPAEDAERMLQVGLKRQSRLTDERNPLTFQVFVDESVLRRTTGNTEIMTAQLRHLLEVGELPNVSIRVVPATVGAYRALLVGIFVLLEFPRHPTADLTVPPVVYVQGFLGDLYLESADEIRQYRQACAELDRLALDEAGSRTLIFKIAKEYDSER
ncbi:helix-turn-helix domain-containing protein [Nocardia beijingensis]|uniref:helix-turn-helix domain-containing protein n=1 Tax=Nocardia beijingensis TaxID=95162 RepID=UPI001894B0A5|nr:helix-turn-helix transcriptional regulator [Nocardia beijingensis]MBF6464878.1 helix-turn-helix domain-containing protein [Nocardia beijingensis]